jgi:hypothetical protein
VLTGPDLWDVVVLRELSQLLVVLLDSLAMRLAGSLRQARSVLLRQVGFVLELRFGPAGRCMISEFSTRRMQMEMLGDRILRPEATNVNGTRNHPGLVSDIWQKGVLHA